MSQHRRTRREFLTTAAAAGSLAVLAPEEVFALLQNGNFVRPNLNSLNANSPDVVAYKAGINAMRALPANNPLNWNTWANIHGSPSGTGPLWNSCQHGHWWFLPWHRLYLLFSSGSSASSRTSRRSPCRSGTTAPAPRRGTSTRRARCR